MSRVNAYVCVRCVSWCGVGVGVARAGERERVCVACVLHVQGVCACVCIGWVRVCTAWREVAHGRECVCGV